MRIDPRQEWKQIIHEAWRIERDFYWDPKMTGHNWEQIGKRYEALLPWVAHRADLNYLLGEMIAELNTSHTYVGGGDQPQVPQIGVGLLGVDFEADGGYYRIAKIYPGENWSEATRSPLTEPGLKVKSGDYLIAVNGQEAKSSQDVYAYFQNLAGKLVTLKVNGNPRSEGAWEIIVKPIGNEAGVRYLDWINNNRKRVEEATGGRIGYMHVPDTSIDGIIQFDKALNAQLDKDGIIVDERDNSGGQIPDFYTEKLKRQLLAVVAPRDTADVPWPPVAIYGPKIMIVNELAGSGGDAFPWFFRREKIGPIVGERTWGGLGRDRRRPTAARRRSRHRARLRFLEHRQRRGMGRRESRRRSRLRRAPAAGPGRERARPAIGESDRAGEGSVEEFQRLAAAAEVSGSEAVEPRAQRTARDSRRMRAGGAERGAGCRRTSG